MATTSLNTLALLDPLTEGEGGERGSNSLQWWTRGDSNPRPPRCERGALPAELLAQSYRLLTTLYINHLPGSSWDHNQHNQPFFASSDTTFRLNSAYICWSQSIHGLRNRTPREALEALAVRNCPSVNRLIGQAKDTLGSISTACVTTLSLLVRSNGEVA
jgi:hypothetical protein